MSDPWLDQHKTNENTENCTKLTNRLESGEENANLEFEDNFAPTAANLILGNQVQLNGSRSNSNEHQPLPDSATYLQGLERKLEKLKKGAKLVEALTEKREDSMRTLLQEGESSFSAADKHEILELDTPISSGDSTVQDIVRHLQPVQPVTVGETVHIVKYDQLEEREEVEEIEKEPLPEQ